MDSLKFKVWSGPVKLFPVDAICFVANILIRVCSLFVRSLVLVGKKSRINARLVSFDSALSVFVRSFVRSKFTARIQEISLAALRTKGGVIDLVQNSYLRR
jgi:hypothetical protein